MLLIFFINIRGRRRARQSCPGLAAKLHVIKLNIHVLISDFIIVSGWLVKDLWHCENIKNTLIGNWYFIFDIFNEIT